MINSLLCVCVCYQNMWTTNNIGTSIELPTGLKLYKIKGRLFLKPFSYKVITIFTTHNCHFTILRLLVAKEYMETQLIMFTGYHYQSTAQN